MATISDVARLAEVSVATVSRYLNESGYVGAKSRESIQSAIKELNYVPSEVARSLSTKQSDIIGLIIPDIKNPFFPELARAVEDTAFEYGYTVILCNSDENANKEKHYLEKLTKKYVAGIILTSIIEQENHWQKVKLPIVALDRPINSNVPTVTTNNEKGAKIATDYLIACGATNLLCISGPDTFTSSQTRVDGFNLAATHKNINTYIIESPYDFEIAEKILYDYLKNNPAIDGIFACSDASAIGALKAAHRLGICIPEDLQIVGFDGIQVGNVVTPSLTTVAQNIYQLGQTAAKLLIKQIEGHKLTQESVCIDPELIIRETTRKERFK
ncbi:LacI family DNA-binding transcriptional regulator [Ureibacillus aquaedulcis]|uniref:LacI family DNA-binding transcriptional regulator n=1 Tax=Ureibacillus aquaedulcis TaxID=3058421 RepID=A0ABT8GQV4_9BACL|nr:LacI family DNA-binding transcriptional regulator [Ureibacillus sp. BA0131]MDN4493780.1 LacI family DNA-binding transcriptional regulator [Ureibacillus sp. BA0131]